MGSKHICLSIHSPKPNMQSHMTLSGTKIILGIGFSFVCCLFASVEVVRLGTKRPTLSPGSTVWHRVPVTRQAFDAGGLPTHKTTRINLTYCPSIHITKVHFISTSTISTSYNYSIYYASTP